MLEAGRGWQESLKYTIWDTPMCASLRSSDTEDGIDVALLNAWTLPGRSMLPLVHLYQSLLSIDALTVLAN